MGPVVQNGVIEAARVRGGSLVSAANQAAFNVANAIGAALGALVISLGMGLTAPIWVGAALALTGSVLAVAVRRADRREAARVGADVRRWREEVGSRLDTAA
jgi:DHA1 family inner membrane transport protein